MQLSGKRLGVEQGGEEQNKGDPSKASEGRREPQTRTSQPFQPRLRSVHL